MTQETIVSLTFDDGNSDNFSVAPVLKEYGAHATFYIPSNQVGRSSYMTWDQLHMLQNDGHEIGGHTLDHVNVGELEPAALRHEICDDRKNFLDHGFSPISFAYPFGGLNQAAKQMVRQCGYSDARTIAAGPEHMPLSDAYALRAFPYVVVDTDFTKLLRYVVGTRQEGGGWVILIFHHVCDACDYFAVKPDVLSRFIRWLAEQQTRGLLRVQTVGEVVRENVLP
jgi:peptidoglycan/xylan/chitin deacetylase (PgdA/CDA1 family)